MPSRTAITAIKKSLREIVGPEAVRDDPDSLFGYAVDGVKPWTVVLPGSTEEVAEVVRLCRRERLSLVPRGSGSKMAEGNIPERLDLVIGTERLHRTVDMDTANLTVTVEAGVRFKEIQSALALEENRCYLPLEDPDKTSEREVCSDRENRGCFIPMMPPCSRRATLGGIVAADSIGPTRLLYGLPRDMVLGVRYVSATGEVVGMGGNTVKNVSGYDVSKLMIGSRGTLGILCELTLRLLPLPERVGTGLFAFESRENAFRFADMIFETRLLPAAVELLNHRACGFLAPGKAVSPGKGGYTVAVALEGVEEAVARMRTEFKDMGSSAPAEAYLYLEGDDHKRFWEAYSNLGTTLSADRPGLVSVRVNVPISSYRDLIELADSLIHETRLDCAILSHAGCGICILHCLCSPGDGDSARQVASVVDGLLERCGETGGNLFVERALPELKTKLPLWGLARGDQVVMRRIKEQMDPDRLFSPGRFVGGI